MGRRACEGIGPAGWVGVAPLTASAPPVMQPPTIGFHRSLVPRAFSTKHSDTEKTAPMTMRFFPHDLLCEPTSFMRHASHAADRSGHDGLDRAVLARRHAGIGQRHPLLEWSVVREHHETRWDSLDGRDAVQRRGEHAHAFFASGSQRASGSFSF